MKTAITLIAVLLFSFTHAQTYNVAYGDIDFGGTGVTITNKVGNGTSSGDVVLYENVITIGSQQIDAIVRTTSTSNTMINFDNPSTSGASMSNNQARFFSPQFNFSGAGSAMFRFEFILGGSYNNSNDSGDIVTLQNVKINTYDIDGNGSSGTNQFNEFGGFDSVTLGANTNIQMSYNTTSGLTRFRSNSSTNVSNVLDDDTRVKVSYSSLSSFSIAVGADAGGYAYFFIDFGPGGSWSATPDIYYTPTLDLYPGGGGIDHNDTFCSTPTHITDTGANLSTSNGTIDELYFEFLTSDIVDGANEVLIIGGASSGDTIELNFSNGASIPNIVFSGVTFNVTATVGSQYSRLAFNRSSGTWTESQAEQFLDSLKYLNKSPTSGWRNFNISAREIAFTSPPTTYGVLVDCSILPVELLYFDVLGLPDNTVNIKWATSHEAHNAKFILERSANNGKWIPLQYIDGNGYSESISHYTALDAFPADGENCYRLVQLDMDDTKTVFDPSCTNIQFTPEKVVLFPNPSHGKISVSCRTCSPSTLKVYNSLGFDVTSQIEIEETNVLNLDMQALNQGVYYLEIKTADETLIKSFTLLK